MGVEPAERGVMQRAPHQPGASLWADGLGRHTAGVGLLIGVAALAVGFAYHEAGEPEWQTMIFTSLAFLQVFQAIGTRSRSESLRTIGLTSNRVMVAIVGIVVALQLAAIYTPLRDFLDLEPLGATDLGICVGLGAALLAVLELVKARRRVVEAAVTQELQPVP
jgi:Ca2+-transporting ATPase